MSQYANLLFAAAALLCAAARADGSGVTTERGEVYESLMSKHICDSQVPGFAERSRALWERYTAAHAAVFAELKAEADAMAKAKAPPAQPDVAQWCDQYFLSDLQHSLSPDPQLATPQKTWATFLAALRAGDRKTAQACFFPDSLERYRPVFDKASDAELRQMAEGFTGFSLGIDMGELQEWWASNKNNEAGAIEFQRVHGEWLITSM